MLFTVRIRATTVNRQRWMRFLLLQVEGHKVRTYLVVCDFAATTVGLLQKPA